jgi:hypothetical protein
MIVTHHMTHQSTNATFRTHPRQVRNTASGSLGAGDGTRTRTDV